MRIASRLLACRLNFGIQSRSSCAPAELYPARESPGMVSERNTLSTGPAHYSHFDPTIRLILIPPQHEKGNEKGDLSEWQTANGQQGAHQIHFTLRRWRVATFCKADG